MVTLNQTEFISNQKSFQKCDFGFQGREHRNAVDTVGCLQMPHKTKSKQECSTDVKQMSLWRNILECNYFVL